MSKIRPSQRFLFLDKGYEFIKYFAKKQRKYQYRIRDVKTKQFVGLDLLKYLKKARKNAGFPFRHEDVKRELYELLPQFFRTQLAQLIYMIPSDDPESETPEPLVELRAWILHKIPYQFSLSDLDGINDHSLRIMNILADRDHDDWKYSIDHYEVIADENSANIGDQITRAEKKAFLYCHRQAIWYKEDAIGDPHSDNFQRGKEKGSYDESDFVNWELYLVSKKSLKAKLHHKLAKLVARSTKRRYTPKYVRDRDLWKRIEGGED